jgi:hypothetical protein
VGKVSAIWKELRSNQKTSDSAGSSRYIAQASRQTMPEFIAMSSLGVAIPVGLTDQKVSGHGGLALFWGFLHWHRVHAPLAGVLPISARAHQPEGDPAGGPGSEFLSSVYSPPRRNSRTRRICAAMSS